MVPKGATLPCRCNLVLDCSGYNVCGWIANRYARFCHSYVPKQIDPELVVKSNQLNLYKEFRGCG